MKRLEFSGAVRPIYGSLGVKRLITVKYFECCSAQHGTEILRFGPDLNVDEFDDFWEG